MDEALGILETKGLAAAVCAADSMIKNTSIKILGKENLTGGYISLFIYGDISSVNEALKIGTQNAEKISTVLAYNVISKPVDEIFNLLNLNFSEAGIVQEEFSEIADKKLEFPSSLKPKDKSLKKVSTKQKESISDNKIKKETNIKNNDTLTRLRNEALKKNGNKPEIKNSGKTDSSNSVNENLESLNVHQLRKLARSTDGFPIKGREISKANRNQLLIHFENLV